MRCCTKHLDNIYKQSRLKRGMGRQAAADFLFVGLRTLIYYESGNKVPEDVVASMSKLYRDPGLADRHIESCRKTFDGKK